MEFVVAGANLRAENFGIKHNRDADAIATMITKVDVPKFVARSGIRIATTEAEAASDNGICGMYM